jgi:transposase
MDDFRVGSVPSSDSYGQRQASGSIARKREKHRDGEPGQQRFGRPRKLSTDQAQVAAQLLAEGKPVRDIARTFNVYEATIYRLAVAS